MKNNLVKNLASLSILMCALVIVLFDTTVMNSNYGCAGGAKGPKVAPTPCDPDYYRSLEARARLEADREVTQNQNLIYKPDSVLSYTCFDLYLEELGDHATDMFSETDRWGNDILGPPGDQNIHMNTALENLVAGSLRTYLEGNFHGTDRGYLGGRSGTDRDTPDLSVPDGTYSCNVMQQIWQQAKCYNFITDTGNDGFYTFEQYAGSPDRRAYPPGSPACSLPEFGINRGTAGILPSVAPPWIEDPTEDYLDRFDAAECGNFDAVPTGLEVERPVLAPAVYDEHVCIEPGCYYDPSSGDCRT